jgi:formylglycine-generating enzyme required for sulfatase activity
MALLLAIGLAPFGAAAIQIDFVVVGNPANAPDPLNSGTVPGIGSVSNVYAIGATEVTLDQYAAFLNAVATADPYGLWNENMASDTNSAGIARLGSSGAFTYAVIGSGERPVTYVSFFDALRFINWLENGQRDGDTEDGAYTKGFGNGVSRNPGALFLLPSENEWYKAAYHQPLADGGDTDDYWFYPMQTNEVPFSDQPPGATPDDTRVGNFFQSDGADNGYDDGYAVSGSTTSPSGDALTDGGAYPQSRSFYGTFDQGGNVVEWNETLIAGASRGLRGGSWQMGATFLRSSDRGFSAPTLESAGVGFRVATVPEPPAGGMQGLALALLAWRAGVTGSRPTRHHPPAPSPSGT